MTVSWEFMGSSVHQIYAFDVRLKNTFILKLMNSLM